MRGVEAKMRAPAWLLALRDSIWPWLLCLRDTTQPGGFLWCRTGSLIKPSRDTGLGASALALKIACQIDRLKELSATELIHWVNYIRSFQTAPPQRFAGFFEDRALLKFADRRRWFKNENIDVRRAETRQACAALLAAGKAPNFPILTIPRTAPDTSNYVLGLPWKKNPWSAGSHVGHLMFFLKLNADFFGKDDEYRNLAPLVLERLDALQDEETGSWFLGDPPMTQKINAAMKVLTIYELLNKPFRWPERLIDFCLTADNDGDACNNVDVLYVLHQCNRLTLHRQKEVQTYAKRKLEVIRNYAKPDGAFSFFANSAGTHYYGVRVSKGLAESDIHGTHLLVWAAALLGDILGFCDELGWKLPIT